MDQGGAASEEINVDELLSNIESQSNNQNQQQVSPPNGVSTNPAPEEEHEIDWKGQKVRLPISKVKNLAQQGYDYAQKMGEFNRKVQEFEKNSRAAKELEEKLKPFVEIDSWARQNPDKWLAIEQGYKQSSGQIPEGIDPTNPLVQKLSTIESWISEKQQQEQTAKYKAEDEALDNEIKEIKTQYKNLDFNKFDEQGKTLENRIIEHAAQTGIKTFRAAFRDYCHDQLVNLEVEKAKEKTGKEVSKNSKLGMISNGSKPGQYVSQAQNIKTKSYDKILSETLDELGLR